VIGPAGRVIGIKSAVYNPKALTVTLHPRQRINVQNTYKLIVDGTGRRGLTDAKGALLDGAEDGKPGSDLRTPLTWRNLVSPESSRSPKKSSVKLNLLSAPALAVSHAAGLFTRSLGSRR
jgi:hypothetical protein